MSSMTIERMENLSAQVQKLHAARPRTQKAIAHVLDCQNKNIEYSYSTDMGFSSSLFGKCIQICIYLPLTAQALLAGVSLVSFTDAYNASVSARLAAK